VNYNRGVLRIASYASDCISNLGDHISNVCLWLHGHTHWSTDYEESGIRVAANPRGYPVNQKEDRALATLYGLDFLEWCPLPWVGDNHMFSPHRLIAIDHNSSGG